MKAFIFFTKSDKIGSKLIRSITKEPVSHCAIYVPTFGFVWHATIPKITATSLNAFIKDHTIVGCREIELTPDQVTHMRGLKGSYYDLFTLFYVGLRMLLRSCGMKIPKADLRVISGMYMCTEFVQTTIDMANEPYMTPYQLYNVLGWVNPNKD
jgi:hypothetical protein